MTRKILLAAALAAMSTATFGCADRGSQRSASAARQDRVERIGHAHDQEHPVAISRDYDRDYRFSQQTGYRYDRYGAHNDVCAVLRDGGQDRRVTAGRIERDRDNDWDDRSASEAGRMDRARADSDVGWDRSDSDVNFGRLDTVTVQPAAGAVTAGRLDTGFHSGQVYTTQDPALIPNTDWQRSNYEWRNSLYGTGQSGSISNQSGGATGGSGMNTGAAGGSSTGSTTVSPRGTDIDTTGRSSQQQLQDPQQPYRGSTQQPFSGQQQQFNNQNPAAGPGTGTMQQGQPVYPQNSQQPLNQPSPTQFDQNQGRLDPSSPSSPSLQPQNQINQVNPQSVPGVGTENSVADPSGSTSGGNLGTPSTPSSSTPSTPGTSSDRGFSSPSGDVNTGRLESSPSIESRPGGSTGSGLNGTGSGTNGNSAGSSNMGGTNGGSSGMGSGSGSGSSGSSGTGGSGSGGGSGGGGGR